MRGLITKFNLKAKRQERKIKTGIRFAYIKNWK